jgi:GGDEF domain-containing protein
VDPAVHGLPAPRPVAGLPAVDAREVAKGWLLELMAQTPLDEAATLPVAQLAAEGPGLAGAVLAALSDEAALGRLAPGGDLVPLAARVASLAGGGAAGAVRAAEALRRCTTAAVHAAARLDAQTAAELADRLAFACSLLAGAAASAAPGAAPAAYVPAPAAYVPAAAAAEPAPPAAAPAPVAPPEPGEEGSLRALRRVAEPPPAADAEAWRLSVARRLERHAEDGTPFALLAVEVDGVERLLAAQEAGEVADALERVERALGAELRPADQLLRADRGRYWVTAPDTGPTVARLLAERLADAARLAASHHGAPLTVSIGIAICPEDGADADALAARADEAMFAARAAGTPIA